jgi:hypothetical protein
VTLPTCHRGHLRGLVTGVGKDGMLGKARTEQQMTLSLKGRRSFLPSSKRLSCLGRRLKQGRSRFTLPGGRRSFLHEGDDLSRGLTRKNRGGGAISLEGVEPAFWPELREGKRPSLGRRRFIQAQKRHVQARAAGSVTLWFGEKRRSFSRPRHATYSNKQAAPGMTTLRSGPGKAKSTSGR